MSKKNQLNIRIDEGLIKTLKFMALEKNITLGDLVINILEEKVRNGHKTKVKSFTDLHASNCTSFMRSLFEVKFKKGKYNTPQEAFNEFQYSSMLFTPKKVKPRISNELILNACFDYSFKRRRFSLSIIFSRFYFFKILNILRKFFIFKKI